MTRDISPLMRRVATDEFAAPQHTLADARAMATTAASLDRLAQHATSEPLTVLHDRRATAAALRALNEAWDETYFDVPAEATFDTEAAEAAFGGSDPLIDVQTHLVDAHKFHGELAKPLSGFLHTVDPQRWEGKLDSALLDAAAWAATVFGTSETSIAVLTSTPGVRNGNVLHNGQIAAVREVMDRYAGSGRLLSHTIVHPNIDGELAEMAQYAETLRPNGWKCYTLYGPPTRSCPKGGWFLDDPDVGFPFLDAVRALGPKLVATHKGLGGPIPNARVQAASPRDIGPAAAAYPDITFLVYHSGYEINPDGYESAYAGNDDGVDRLITSLRNSNIPCNSNVYAELGSTWFLMLRRPREAAHVMGKLLNSVGSQRIIWGTDSIWYGSPQPLIDAFRAFVIPDRMQEEFGYPAISAAMKEQMLSANAQRVYSIDDATMRAAGRDRDRTWIPEASRALLAAVDQAR